MTGLPVDRIVDDRGRFAADGAGHTHGKPHRRATTPRKEHKRAGARRGNKNAMKTGLRSLKTGHRGSIHAIKSVKKAVDEDVDRVLHELGLLNPDWGRNAKGKLKLSAATDSVVMQIRRAFERDRTAAWLLAKVK